MSNYSFDMFRVPFLHLNVEDWEQKKIKLKESFDSSVYENNEPDEHTTDYHYKVESGYKDKDVKLIEELFEKELRMFSEFFQFENIEVIISWFEISIKGQQHEVHNHGATGYSAVCFIDFDERYHKPTNFVSPFNDFLKGNALLYQPEQIEEGSLIFFPSAIHHFAPPNYSDVPRMILSFNLKVR